MTAFCECISVADPDLQIRGGGEGGGHPDPEIRGGPGLQKNFFRPFGPHFGRRIRHCICFLVNAFNTVATGKQSQTALWNT